MKKKMAVITLTFNDEITTETKPARGRSLYNGNMAVMIHQTAAKVGCVMN